MQVTVESREGLERSLNITIPSEKVESAYQSKLKEAARTIKMDGFRPGKVPVSTVEQKHGDSIRYEVVDKLMREFLQEAFAQEKLMPVDRPVIDKLDAEPKKDVSFSAVFEVFPEVNFKDLNDLDLDVKTCELTDKDIDDVVEKLRTQHSEWTSVDRAAKDKDQVKMDFDGTIDGEALESGSAKDFSLILGAGTMIPGFEEGLMGAKKDEEREIEATFPEDYMKAELSGKKATFKIKIHEVSEPKLPELDDAFAEKFGIKEGGLAKLKANMQKHMQTEMRNALKMQNKNAAFEKLLSLNEFDIPKGLVEQELQAMFKEAQNHNHEHEHNHKHDHSHEKPEEISEDVRKNLTEPAQRRVKLGLLFRAGIEKLELKADPSDVKKMIEDMASGYDNPDEYVQWYNSDSNRVAQMEIGALEEKLVDTLIEMAKVKETKVSYEELISGKQGQ